MGKAFELGKKGEAIALSHYQNKGYSLIASNWRFKKLELDLILRKDDLIVFVEVKTRGDDYFGPPESFLSEEQQLRLVEAANQFLIELDENVESRFDILAIIKNKNTERIRQLKDAIKPHEL